MIYRQLIKLPLLIVSLLCTSALADVPLTSNQLHATLGIVTNFILDDIVMHHGKTYKPVVSPHTGRVWLDRNIGANQKCTSLDDASCYGDYFQWGRTIDGHQNSIDSTTMLATDINNAGAEFVRGTFDWTTMDLNYGNSRATNWLKTDGSTVCPVGYRVPLRNELDAEVENISNKETAYANFLKFPAAGYRNFVDANSLSMGTWGTVWSASSTQSMASYFRFWSVSDWKIEGKRAWGLSVRCIKHEGKPLIYHNGTRYDTVTSPYTGKVWLDRNLGAVRVCESFVDEACYGYYYQWGRNSDGHQDPASGVSAVLASNVDDVGDTFFITNATDPWDWASIDSTGAIRATNWSAKDGTSVCPVGFRVPLITELKLETLDNGVTNRDTAFSNFLKLPSAGSRSNIDDSFSNVDTGGFVWSSSVGGGFSPIVYFNSSNGLFSSAVRAGGLSVRCVKD